MAPDRIIAAIERQDLACTLLALRTHLRELGQWSEAEFGPAFAAKRKQLESRWKRHG